MKRYSLPCLLAMLTFAIVSCTETSPTGPEADGQAGIGLSKHKPGHGGGPGGDSGPAPTGTVFFYGDDEWPAVSGSNYSADPDGNSRVDRLVLDVPGTPSNDQHGGSYWFATVRAVADTLPDGNPRREIFLEREGGAGSVQLTDQFDLEVTEGATWLPGDSALSFVARRITSSPCEAPDYLQYIEGGIYSVSVTFDGSGVPSPDGPASLLISAPGECHPAISPAVWSPAGDSVSFLDEFDNLVTGPVDAEGVPISTTALTPGGVPQSWSAKGEILFVTAGGIIHRIDSDGSDQTILVELGNDRSAGHAVWSPDGNHFAYREVTLRWRGPRRYVTADVYRADRNGNDRKNLTRDFEYAEPTGWR